MVTPLTRLYFSIFLLWAAADAADNITLYRVSPVGKIALCGYYTIKYDMWATSSAAYLYVTDTACNSVTTSPCQPPSSPALIALSCVDKPICSGKTGQPSTVPLCLVVYNRNTNASIDVNLYVTGSFAPVSNVDTGGSSGLSTFEIVLISVGSATGVLILGSLTWLIVWLMRCKPSPKSLQHPHDLDGGTHGAKGGIPVSPTAGMYGMAPPAPLMSPATVYPQPYPMLPPPPLTARSPTALLAPLPPAAYGGYSQPLMSPPPQLVLPPPQQAPWKRSLAQPNQDQATSPPQPLQPEQASQLPRQPQPNTPGGAVAAAAGSSSPESPPPPPPPGTAVAAEQQSQS